MARALTIARTLLARLIIGAAQGLVLLALHRWHLHDRDIGPLYFALVYGAAFLPAPLLAGWGAMRWRPLAVWLGLALAVLLGLGYYASWRVGGTASRAFPEAPSFIFAALVLFICHHLVQVGIGAGRLRGPYYAYFDLSWKHGVQLGLSGVFTGVFWLLLWLGGALFALIGIETLVEIISKDWFAYPVTTSAFAAAVHLTDARASLVNGARALALTLLGWLLPMMALIAVAFLMALPIVGFSGLWGTNFASALLMWATTLLILLINAAYQGGEKPANPVIAWAVRLGSILLVPLCALAAFGLITRASQYGLTTSRIIAVAGLIMLGGYAIGYAIAAVSRGAWMARLGAANVWCAFLSACVLLALLTPLADPSRLAVQSQMGRLARGSLTPEAFDYGFLARGGARWGKEALQSLSAASGDARTLQIAALAKWTLAKQLIGPGPIDLAQRRAAVPDRTGQHSASIPDGAYLALQSGRDPVKDCIEHQAICSVRQIDLTGDQRPEILLFDGSSVLVLEPGEKADSPWREAANACCVPAEAWAKGEFTLVPQRYQGLKAGDTTLNFTVAQPVN